METFRVPRPPHASSQTLRLFAALPAEPARWRYGCDLSRETGLASGTLHPILMRLAAQRLLDTDWEAVRWAAGGLRAVWHERRAKSKTLPKRVRMQRAAIAGTLLAVPAAILVHQVALTPRYMPSGSMEPTVRVQDRFLVDKLSFRLTGIKRGDLVEFTTPQAPDIHALKRARLLRKTPGRCEVAALTGTRTVTPVVPGRVDAMQAAGRVRAAGHEPPGEWSPSPGLGVSDGQRHATTRDQNLILIFRGRSKR
jgi:hypothetical protein